MNSIDIVLRFAAQQVVPRLAQTTDELDHVLHALDGGFIPAGPSGSATSPASAIRIAPRSTGPDMSAGLYRRSASRTAAGVACAPVGDSDVRQAGTPISARSTSPSVASNGGQSPARGQRSSCESATASTLPRHSPADQIEM